MKWACMAAAIALLAVGAFIFVGRENEHDVSTDENREAEIGYLGDMHEFCPPAVELNSECCVGYCGCCCDISCEMSRDERQDQIVEYNALGPEEEYAELIFLHYGHEIPREMRREERQDPSVYDPLEPVEENAELILIHYRHETPHEMQREERQDPRVEYHALEPEEEIAMRILDWRQRPPVQCHWPLTGLGEMFL